MCFSPEEINTREDFNDIILINIRGLVKAGQYAKSSGYSSTTEFEQKSYIQKAKTVNFVRRGMQDVANYMNGYRLHDKKLPQY